MLPIPLKMYRIVFFYTVERLGKMMFTGECFVHLRRLVMVTRRFNFLVTSPHQRLQRENSSMKGMGKVVVIPPLGLGFSFFAFFFNSHSFCYNGLHCKQSRRSKISEGVTFGGTGLDWKEDPSVTPGNAAIVRL